MTVQQDLSLLLDALGQQPGDMLVRGPTVWNSLPAGQAGWVLTSAGPLLQPAWLPNNPFSPLLPPALTEFPNLFGNAALVKEAGAAGSFCMALDGTPVTNTLDAYTKPLPAPPRTYTAFVTGIVHTPVAYQHGLVLMDAASPRLLTIGLRGTANADKAAMTVRRWNSTGSIASEPWFVAYNGSVQIWMRIVDDGVNFTFQFSAGGAAWITAFSEARTAWLTTPDRIGPHLTEAIGSIFGASVAILAWSETNV